MILILAVIAVIIGMFVLFGKSGWHQNEAGQIQYYRLGKPVTEWQTIDDEYYYFSDEGIMLTGWQKIDGKRYFFGTTDGKMCTDWQTIDDKKYYFGNDGVMRTGWQTIDGIQYYFDENGVLNTEAKVEQNDSAEDPLIWGLDMTLEEFEQRSAQLLETASTWTMETAPQTLDDFPLFPPSVFELFETVKSAEEKLTVSDSTLIWESELAQILPKTNTRMEYSRNFEYVDNNENACVRWSFEQIDNNEYAAQIPENAWGANNGDFALFFGGHSYFNGWNESLQVSYPISGKQIDDPSFIGLIMLNHQYSIAWYNYTQESIINVDIYTWPDGRIWYMTYDAASGKLINMSK